MKKGEFDAIIARIPKGSELTISLSNGKKYTGTMGSFDLRDDYVRYVNHYIAYDGIVEIYI